MVLLRYWAQKRGSNNNHTLILKRQDPLQHKHWDSSRKRRQVTWSMVGSQRTTVTMKSVVCCDAVGGFRVSPASLGGFLLSWPYTNGTGMDVSVQRGLCSQFTSFPKSTAFSSMPAINYILSGRGSSGFVCAFGCC